MKTFHTLFLSVLFIGLYSQAGFDPVEYHAPKALPLEGTLTPNTKLVKTRLLGENKIQGPEGIAIDKNGYIYTGTRDGNVLRIDPRTYPADNSLVKIGNTGGRALGIAVHPDGRLIIADATQGLIAMDMQGRIEVLAKSADGRRFGMLDDLDIASDDKIYFSEGSYKYGADDAALDALESRPNGRFLVYDPKTQQTTVLIKQLYFANGVALSKDEDFVLIAESTRYRITRYWIKGEKAGTSDIFADNLPGFPDNLSRSEDGQFWVAMVAPRNALLDFMHRHPNLKKLVVKLPKSIWAKQKKYGLVLKMTVDGKVEKSFHDPKAVVVSAITAVEQFGDALFFGTFEGNWVGQLDLNP